MINKLINLGCILSERKSSTEIVVTDISGAGVIREWTCKAIEDGSNAIASFLQKKNLKDGSRVGIFAVNSAQNLMAYLGIMRSGYVCVPINTKQPTDIVNYICDDAEIQFAFVDEALKGDVPEIIETFLLEQVHTLSVDNLVSQVSENDTALILYTSGSTGQPKGVVLSHASQISMIQAYTSGTASHIFFDQRGIVVAPMFHMNALIFIKSFLLGGGSIVLMSKFETSAFVEAIEKYKVNVITGVPTMIAILHKEKISFASRDLSSVKIIYIGSAPVTETIVGLSHEMMPKAKIYNSYGTTETGGGLFGSHPHGTERPPTSVGYPGIGIQLRIVGGGEQGVLEVKSPSAMTEYLNSPEVTAEKFKDGWFNTGDIFKADENGFYFFVGRADDMFVCSGENIYPGEVEKAIETYYGIIEAVVVPVDDKVRGKMPVAFVASKLTNLCEKDIQEYVKKTIAPYLYPRRVWFLESMPLGSTNKVDRKFLTQKASKSIARTKVTES